MNLHELSGKNGKTATAQSDFIRKGYLFGKEPLFPVTQEAADDISAVTLIDGRIPVHEVCPTFFRFVSGNDFHLFIHGNLRIGNHERRKKGMGMVTAGTDKAADAERGLPSRHFQGTGIVPMNRKTTGVTAGTGKFVELQLCNKIIIKIWC